MDTAITHYAPDTITPACGNWTYPEALTSGKAGATCPDCTALIAAGDAPAERDLSHLTDLLRAAGADI